MPGGRRAEPLACRIDGRYSAAVVSVSPPLPWTRRLWRALPRSARRAAAGQVAAMLAPHPDAVPPTTMPGLAVAGELDRESGLGEGARLMLQAAASAGYQVYPLCLTDRAAPLPPPGVPVVVHANAPHFAAALLGLPHALVRGRLVIGYWAWDLPVAPAGWRVGLDFVHEIWVPSRFTERALAPLAAAALGGARKLRRIPHPAAVRPPCPSPLGRKEFGFEPETVVVLTCFSLASSFERKNPLGTIAAFRAAFGDRADRLLVIKVTGAHSFPADLARLRTALSACNNIRLDTRLLPAADVHAMMACADIVLSLHRAEGFGLVPAEAMLLGKPVIATSWSGNMDYMTAASAALVGYRLIRAVDPRGVFTAPGAMWAEPNQNEAVAQLRRLANDPAARAALGAAAAVHARRVLGAEMLEHALAELTAA